MSINASQSLKTRRKITIGCPRPLENRRGVESVLTISRILVSMLKGSRRWREAHEVEDAKNLVDERRNRSLVSWRRGRPSKC
jgi:hypothetical protein